MTVVSNNDIARAIYLASKDSDSASQFSTKVIQFLNKKRLFSKVPDILLRLGKIINDDEGRIVARVSSRGMLNEKTKRELANILTKRYPGKVVTIISILDEKLLGGFKIEVNDEIIDLTIKNKIKKLQEYLIRSHE